MSEEFTDLKKDIHKILGDNFGTATAGSTAGKWTSKLTRAGFDDQQLKLAFRPKSLANQNLNVGWTPRGIVTPSTGESSVQFTPAESGTTTPGETIYTPSTGSATPESLYSKYDYIVKIAEGDGEDKKTFDQALKELTEDEQHEAIWVYGMSRLMANEEAPNEDQADKILSDRITCIFRTTEFLEHLHADVISSGIMSAKDSGSSKNQYALSNLKNLMTSLKEKSLTREKLLSSMAYYKDVFYSKDEMADELLFHAYTKMPITRADFVTKLLDTHDDIHWTQPPEAEVIKHLVNCTCADSTNRNSIGDE